MESQNKYYFIRIHRPYRVTALFFPLYFILKKNRDLPRHLLFHHTID